MGIGRIKKANGTFSKKRGAPTINLKKQKAFCSLVFRGKKKPFIFFHGFGGGALKKLNLKKTPTPVPILKKKKGG